LNMLMPVHAPVSALPLPTLLVAVVVVHPAPAVLAVADNLLVFQ
jgi:hypothetical protein